MLVLLVRLFMSFPVLSSPDSVDNWLLDHAVAGRFFESGEYRIAADRYEALVRRAEAMGDRELLLCSRHGLASSLAELGRSHEAKQLFSGNLAAIPSDASALRRLRLHTLLQLVSFDIRAAQYGAADRLLNEIGKSAEMAEMPELEALYYSSRGIVQARQGRTAEAESTLREGLRRATATSAGPSGLVYLLLNTIGALILDNGRPGEAAEYLERALVEIDGALGPNHPLSASILFNLSVARFATAQFELAEKSAARAAALIGRSSGPMHPDTGRALGIQGAALRKLGRNKEAKAIEKRAKAILTAAGESSPTRSLVSVSDLRGAPLR